MLLAGRIPVAHAGAWVLISCTQPNGRPAPTDGWRATAIGSLGADSGTGDSCAAGDGTLSARDSSLVAEDAYSGPMWEFSAPAGSTIDGGIVSVALYTPQGQAFVATPSDSYDAADVIVNCQFNVPCNSSEHVVPITHAGGTSIFAAAQCAPAAYGAAACPAGDGANGVNATLELYSAAIKLDNSSTPTGSDFSGPALQSPVRGTEDLLFTAGDPGGPGVWFVNVLLDGKSVYDATPERNGGRCASIGTQPGGAPEFLYEQPCKQSIAVDVPIDSTPFPDGRHTLRVIVEDAALNSSTVYSGVITTQNASAAAAPQTTGGGAEGPGAAPLTTPAAHAPNGSNACEDARLTLRFGASAVATVPLGRGAILHGALECGGAPVANAQLAVVVTPSGGRGPPPVAVAARSAGDGSFAFDLAPGPSRQISVSYRAFSDDARPAAEADARLRVIPRITLRIRPEHTRNGRTITYSGRVEGGYIPAGGLALNVQYLDIDRWRTFDETVARARDGRFVYRYTFRRTTRPVTYTFRVALPPTGVSGYPYQPGASPPRSVRVDG